MRRFLTATLLLVPTAGFSAGPTSPAPEPVVAPVMVAPPPPRDYDWSGGSVGLVLGYGQVETSGSSDVDGDGVIGGLRLNYDFDFGRTVAGLGFDYMVSDIELGDGGPSLDSVLRLKGRAGVDSGRNLYYLTGGWARADVSDDVGNSDGYFLGLGYEVFLTDRVTAGAEALYHDFNGFDSDEDLDATATTLDLSINFRF